MPVQPSSIEMDFDAVRCLSAPLARKLEAYSQKIQDNRPNVAEVYDKFVNRLVSSGASKGALGVGSSLLPFLLPDSDGQLVNSEDLLTSGPLVLSFNRGHWCSFCGFELLALAEIHPKVKLLGGEIVSVTPEKALSARNLKVTYNLPFPALCDIDNGYALANGLMISIGEAVRQAYLAYDIDLAAYQGNHGIFLPIPATYIVAPDGVILNAFVNLDFRKRMPPEDVIATLEALTP